jgi:hypothetical protein
MTPSDATRWCPHCRQPTQNAPLPQLGDDVAMFGPLPGTDDPQAFRRKLYCTQCTTIWESLELPSEFVKSLLAARQLLEETQRQLAMLKLVAAKQRQADQQPAAQPARPALRLAG